MNIFDNFKDIIVTYLERLVEDGTLPNNMSFKNITVESPRDKTHGEISTNAAMIVAKEAKLNPRQIAQAIAVHLKKNSEIVFVEIAEPAFVNFCLKPEIWLKVLEQAITLKSDFGSVNIGYGRLVNIEYVSANPTGPLHVGHTRGAVFGDALAGLLSFVGYSVTKEYYVNDGGAQIDVLARSAYLRYLEANGKEVVFSDGFYPGDYLIGVGLELKKYMVIP